MFPEFNSFRSRLSGSRRWRAMKMNVTTQINEWTMKYNPSQTFRWINWWKIIIKKRWIVNLQNINFFNDLCPKILDSFYFISTENFEKRGLWTWWVTNRNIIEDCCFTPITRNPFVFWMSPLEHISMICACHFGARTNHSLNCRTCGIPRTREMAKHLLYCSIDGLHQTRMW